MMQNVVQTTKIGPQPYQQSTPIGRKKRRLENPRPLIEGLFSPIEMGFSAKDQKASVMWLRIHGQVAPQPEADKATWPMTK